MRTSRLVGVVVATLAVVGLALPAAAETAPDGLPENTPPAARAPAPALPAAEGWPLPETFPATAGTGRIDGGALLWTDFLYDDHGAIGTRTEPPVAGLAPPWGSYRYPEGAAAGNGADVFRAAIGVDGGDTFWRVDWTTLADASVPIAAFAIDAGAGGAETWPAGAGVTSPGSDAFLVLSGAGAWLHDAEGQVTPVDELGGAHTVDDDARSFVARVPTDALEASGEATIRLVAGLADDAGDGFADVGPAQGALPGQPAVYDIGFVDHDDEEPTDFNLWRERAQAEALTAGDVRDFGVTLDWDALAAGDTTDERQPTGFSNRWFVSSVELGDGVEPNESPTGDVGANFLGRVQPYGVYVPETLDAAGAPLTLLLHSLGVNHNQYGSLNPDFLAAACAERGSICATPLARGPSGWYFAEAELDVWEVWRDLADAFPLDPDRTVLAGYSMGGYGTYKLGLAYPDLFAQSIALAAPPTCGVRAAGPIEVPASGPPGAPDLGPVPAPGEGEGEGRCATDADTTPLVVNSEWLPTYIAHGAADQLVPISSVVEQVARYDELGYRYRFDLYPIADHLAYALLDEFGPAAEAMGDARRRDDPGHFTYTWYPNLVDDELGIGPVGPWWIGGLAAHDNEPGSRATVTVDSAARPEPQVTVHQDGRPGDIDQPTPSVVAEQTWELGDAPEPDNTLAVTLTGVAALTVELARAGLVPDETGRVDVDTDDATTLRLADVPDGTPVLVDGSQVATGDGAPVPVDLAAGERTITFALDESGADPADTDEPPAPTPSGALPATGGSLAAGLLLLAGGAALGRHATARPRAAGS